MPTNNANSLPIPKIVVPILLLGVLLYLAVTHPWWLIGIIVLIVFLGRLLPGTALFDKMLQREENIELATKLSVSQVALIFRDTLSGVGNHVKFADINRTDRSPFGQFEMQPDFAASASVIRKFNAFNSWLLRLYIIDNGKDSREVFVVVV